MQGVEEGRKPILQSQGNVEFSPLFTFHVAEKGQSLNEENVCIGGMPLAVKRHVAIN